MPRVANQPSQPLTTDFARILTYTQTHTVHILIAFTRMAVAEQRAAVVVVVRAAYFRASLSMSQKGYHYTHTLAVCVFHQSTHICTRHRARVRCVAAYIDRSAIVTFCISFGQSVEILIHARPQRLAYINPRSHTLISRNRGVCECVWSRDTHTVVVVCRVGRRTRAIHSQHTNQTNAHTYLCANTSVLYSRLKMN